MKLDKALKAKLDSLNDDQLSRKVDELKQTIPELNEQLDYSARMLRDRRNIAARKALDDARRRANKD